MADPAGDDRWFYIPGAYVPCFVSLRQHIRTERMLILSYPDYVLEARGTPRPRAREPLEPAACRRRLHYEKLTAQDVWLARRGSFEQVRAAGCADNGGQPMSETARAAMREQMAVASIPSYEGIDAHGTVKLHKKFTVQ